MLHTSKIIFTIGAYLDKRPHDVKYVWSFFMFVTKARKKCHKKLIFTCLMKAFKSNKDYGHSPLGSSKFRTISSFKVITLCLAWHDSNAKMHFLLEIEFPFASSSSTTTKMESLSSNLSQSP
jgi:hypothetical protein